MGVRKNAWLLNNQDVAVLASAFTRVMAISDDRGYQHWAGVHGLPLPIYCRHHSQLFLYWHRAYLYMFERALQDQVPGATIPWWDWTSSRAHTVGLPPAYTQPAVDGNANPLLSSVITGLTAGDKQKLLDPQNGPYITADQPPRTFRDPDLPDELPRAKTINSILKAPTLDDFSLRLEGVHGDVHGWVGGSMSQVPVAAYDPVFWAHHSMIDRLWYLWQQNHTGWAPPAALLHQALPPFPLTVADTLSIGHLGYSYASQVVP
jgi:tyrosinase